MILDGLRIRGTVIGVSLETDAIRMAESRGGRVTRCAAKAYPAGMSPSSETFPAFVRQCLTGFSSRLRYVPVWVTGCLPGLQVRYLTLPVVKPGTVSDTVYWAFRKDLPFDSDKTLFDYAVEAESGGGGEKRLRVTAYTAPRDETEALTAIFEKAGIRPAGVVIPAFAIRAAMQAMPPSGVEIGLFAAEDASTVVVMRDGQVLSCRVFKTGMHAILGDIRDLEPELTPAAACRKAREWFERAETERDAVATSSVREGFDRLVQQVERTIAAYLNEDAGQPPTVLRVMGPLAGLTPMVRAMAERLALDVPPMPLPAAADERTEDDERGLTALASGVSRSRLEWTPNLLCTNVRRERLARRSWWSILVALLLGLGGALAYLYRGVLEHGNERLARRLSAGEAALAVYQPAVDTVMLQALAAHAVAESVALKAVTRQWLAPATLQALTALTPGEIRLTSLDADFSASAIPAAGGRSRTDASVTPAGRLKLKGIVRGPHSEQRSMLAAFALRLEDSPLFSRAAVTSASEGLETADTVLLFEMEADVTGAIRQPDAPVRKETNP